MRLFDYVSQSRAPFEVVRPNGEVFRLCGAADFAAAVDACPLRYVLTDSLARTCAELAYSDGESLTSCLDLLRVPSERLWVEWNDGARRQALPGSGGLPADASPALRAGALIHAARDGRSGRLRTFWTTRENPADPLVASLETHFDFDGGLPAVGSLEALFDGALAGLPATGRDALDPLLGCVRYRFDPSWVRYHQQDRLSPELREQVLRQSLASVAHDLPVLIALSLLLTVQGGLPTTASNLARLNAKRRRLGRAPLLEHVEVSVPVFREATPGHTSPEGDWRRPPRFHHVRGHLVRRANAIFWRAPHWRGHLRLGRVRSRTVVLEPARPGPVGPGSGSRQAVDSHRA
jgi:hypothetical protein